MKQLSATAAQAAYAQLPSHPFNQLDSPAQIDLEVHRLADDLRQVRNLVVPLGKPSDKFCKPWWTPACSEAVKSASNARNRASRHPTATHRVAQDVAFRRKKAVLRHAERQFEKRQLESVQPTTLWDRVCSQLTSRGPTSIPTLTRQDGSLATSHKEKVEVFRNSWFGGSNEVSASVLEADPSSPPRQNHVQPLGGVLGKGIPQTPPTLAPRPRWRM